MHYIQKKIIKRLVKKDGRRFSELTKGYSAEDNILFHLKQLIKGDYLKKDNNLYYLTKNGLECSGKFSLDNLEEQNYKNVYIGFICKKGNRYLLRERTSGGKKFYKFPGFKPLLGESMKEARLRLFKQATGLEMKDENFTYRSTHFKIQRTAKGEVLFDDALVLYDIDISDFSDREIKLREGNKWFSLAEIKRMKDKWPEIDLTLLDDKQETIYEYDFVNDYNLKDF